MRIVPKTSVRTRLTLAILIVILLSWLFSSAAAYFFVYREMLSLRQSMLNNPARYPMPIPEPRFNLLDFLLGYQLHFGPPGDHGPGDDDRRPPRDFDASDSQRHNMDFRRFKDPQRDFHIGVTALPPKPVESPRWAIVVSRIAMAFLLALFAGAWLGRRFTRPLLELTKGAKAVQQGDFRHRVPVRGYDEFSQVATAMNQMAERVSVQISDLEADAERRRQLLADVAHELRSPVTTMSTMAGALEQGLAEDPERRARALRSIVNTSNRLADLVADLLELAKLDLKELPLHKREVDLRELAGNVFQTHSEAAERAGLVLCPVPPGESIKVTADPDRLTQVFGNLLENAISYAGEGAQVRIAFVNGDPMKVTLSDTGRGISAQHLPYLFDAFYRVDTARTPGDSHSGLGLRIARGLIEAHGGELNLASEEGKGTRVEILLPRLPA